MNKLSYSEWLQLYYKDYKLSAQIADDWLMCNLMEEYDRWCEEQELKEWKRKHPEIPRPKFKAGDLIKGAYHNGDAGGPWVATTGLVIDTGLPSPAAKVAQIRNDRSPYAQVLWPDGQATLVSESDLKACKSSV